MGCGASKTLPRHPSPTASQRAYDVEVMLRLDGENVKSVTPDKIVSLLATKLRTSSARFSVQIEQSVPNIMHCTIRAQDELDTAMRHMAERQAVQMIARQIKLQAADGQLALEKVMITEVALPGEQLKDEDGLWADVVFRETIREVWQQADTDRNGYLDVKEFKDLLLSDTIGLGLQEREVEEILLKVDVNSDEKVVFAEFLPLCKELLCAIYAKLNVETVGDWCQLWSIKTGRYYFNKRTGRCQYEEPAGYVSLPVRSSVQARPSEGPIDERPDEEARDSPFVRKASSAHSDKLKDDDDVEKIPEAVVNGTA